LEEIPSHENGDEASIGETAPEAEHVLEDRREPVLAEVREETSVS
jgi:hypothetical protein